MKKILGLVFGLLFTLPAFATDLDPCRNLFDGQIEQGGIGHANGTLAPSSTQRLYSVNFIDIQPNTSYALSAVVTEKIKQGMIFFYDNNENFIGMSSNIWVNLPFSATSPANAYKARFVLTQSDEGTILTPSDAQNVQFEQGSTATEYVPYNAACGGCDGGLVTYQSATGTVSQNGTPTPTNPIYPTFYKQGNMVLRKVGDVADSYDASTGKITRRVGVKVFDGTETWEAPAEGQISVRKTYLNTNVAVGNYLGILCTHYPSANNLQNNTIYIGGSYINFLVGEQYTVQTWKEYLAAQYAAGTPVTLYYPLETPTEETVGTTWCDLGIKVATKRYSDSKFSPVMTALNSAISTIKSVVTNTINQAAAVSALQTGKQTMPNASATNGTCPNYKQCLLVETSDGKPQWFVITDPFRDFVAPIIGANLAPENYSNPTESYTQLQYIESTGTQYIDTGVFLSGDDWEFNIHYDIENASEKCLFGVQPDSARLLVLYNKSLYLQAVGNAGTNRIRSNIYPSSNHTLNIRINNGTVQYQVDNGTAEQYSDVGSTEFDTSIFSVSSLKIFAYYNNGSIQSWRIAAGKLYSFSIKHNGTLVRDFVPVVNNTTGKYGMYDKVNGMFYGNANTASGAADFTAGPMVDNDAGVPNISWIANWNAAPASNMSAGSANGTSRCNNLVASANALATSATLSDANWSTAGNNCWCKVLSINVGGIVTDVSNQNLWSFHKTDASCNTGCNQWCGYAVKYARDCRNAIMNIN